MGIFECFMCSKELSKDQFTMVYAFDKPETLFLTWDNFEDEPTKSFWYTLNEKAANEMHLKLFENADDEFVEKYETELKDVFGAARGSDANSITSIITSFLSCHKKKAKFFCHY